MKLGKVCVLNPDEVKLRAFWENGRGSLIMPGEPDAPAAEALTEGRHRERKSHNRDENDSGALASHKLVTSLQIPL
jgi:hypothetical protein